MRVVMLGPPGSGKGTQSALLAGQLGLPHVVASDVLREHGAQDAARHEADERMASGDLIDDETAVSTVLGRLGRPDAEDGFVLDGFPRNRAQADALDDWLQRQGGSIAVVPLLEVGEDALRQRLASGATRHRPDDDPHTLTHRLQVFDEETGPVIAHYEHRGLLRRVDGAGTEAEVAERVRRVLPTEEAPTRPAPAGTT